MTTFDGNIYEHPLHERIRVFIRVETLFNRIDELMLSDSAWAGQGVITIIGDLLGILQRGDMKSELLKELDRHAQTFTRWLDHEDADPCRLEEFLLQLRELTADIHDMSGPFGGDLKRDEFLNSVIQRCGIPGGTCSFDLPILHYFLARPFDERQAFFLTWLKELSLLRAATRLILKLTRGSAIQRRIVIENGVYNQILEKARPVQLIQIRLPADAPVYPEISGNKLQFTIRLMVPGWSSDRPAQTAETFEGLLGVCII